MILPFFWPYQIQAPTVDYISVIRRVLASTRGKITAEVPQPGTPAFIVKVSG